MKVENVEKTLWYGISFTARKDAMICDGSRIDFSPKDADEARKIALAMMTCARYLYGDADSADAEKACDFLKERMNETPTASLARAMRELDSNLEKPA